MAGAKGLGKVVIFGKKGTEEPFPVRVQKGVYYFISTEDYKKLCKFNEALTKSRSKIIKPLDKIKIVGRGGIEGYRPFPLKGKEELYLCILAEHFRHLKEMAQRQKK
ncbi:MAG: hypothetical protein AB1485_04355 [Candidatus Thermoplasmatota archaeon]